MANTKTIIYQTFLLTFHFLIVSCGEQQYHKTENHNSIETCTNTNKEFSFKYNLIDTVPFGEHKSIKAKFRLYNNTTLTQNYIAQSCNDLEYFITFKSDSFKIMPDLNCNASWPTINNIRPNDSITFSTNILQLKNSPKLDCLGLYFLQITPSPKDSLKQNKEIEQLYKAKLDSSKIIWGEKNLP